MKAKLLIYRNHAIRRMFERGIMEQDIQHVLENGEVIQDYLDDTPYPSRLVLGWVGSRPIHVVAANNIVDDATIIITAYEPDPKLWETAYKRRKPS